MMKLDEYLDGIGITTNVLKERVKLVYSVASQMCPEEIEDIFVTDYIKEDGTREYESLWFFSDKYCLEVTCPPKSSPVLVLDWRIRRGDKWPRRRILQSRSLTS